ncbi:unnamed protein product, partial [Didymodactylos carnosus]
MKHLILNDVLKLKGINFYNFIEKEIGPVAKEILEVQGYDTSLSLARNNDDVFSIFNNDIRDLAELRKQVDFDVKNGDDVKFIIKGGLKSKVD